MALQRAENIADLEKMFQTGRRVYLYGAGHYLGLFLNGLRCRQSGCLEKVSAILVTSAKGKAQVIQGIPVMEYSKSKVELKREDYVLLTLGNRYTSEVYAALKDTDACVVEIDFNLFYREAYLEVKESIQPFCDRFPEGLSGLNQPVYGGDCTVWTCWWQGIEEAPAIIRACWESQRRNMPDGFRHIVITKDNYRDYVQFPEYIVEKARAEKIGLAHMADILRVNLLYKYGGLWLDASVYLLEPLADEVLRYPIYTRNLPEVHFGTDTIWTSSFLYAEPGNKLFQFLAEGFFYYFSNYDALKYYYTLDYMMAIACNTYTDIKKQMTQIPYNNEGAYKLRNHLKESYAKNSYADYIKGTALQFLTYKLDWAGTNGQKDTIYEYILKENGFCCW